MSFSATMNAAALHNDPCHPSEWAPSEWTETESQLIPGDNDEEMLCASSFQAAGKVLEQWLSDGQHEPHQRSEDDASHLVAVIPCDSSASSAEHDEDLASLMEVDEQIGENLLGDEVFGGGCMSDGALGCSLSAVSLEYPTLMNSFSALHMVDDMSEEDRRFLAPLLEDSSTTAMDYDAGYIVTDDESFQHQKFSSSSQPSPITDHERYQEIMRKLEDSMKRSQETRRSLRMKTPKTKKYKRRKSVMGVLSSIENSSRQLQTFWQSVQRSPVL
mmetsp:Transcript_4350/g.12510  ORF Transcript_4350/g.12510 Transcript_4350/m.12510 type:complete len:273 (-) Transcript_4350:5161-5979(-)